MKNEKNKSQENEQLRNQQGTQTEQQKLKKEKGTSREQKELEDSEFDSELDESDDVEQGRSGDKFGKQQGRQQDPTKTQQPKLKDEHQGGSGKGIDVG